MSQVISEKFPFMSPATGDQEITQKCHKNLRLRMDSHFNFQEIGNDMANFH